MEQNWCVPLTPQHWPSATEQRATNIHKTHMQPDICCRVNRQPAEWPRVQCNLNRKVFRSCVCLSKESYIFTQSLWCVISFCHYWMKTWRDKEPYRESPSDSVCVCILDVCTWTRPINVTRPDWHSQNKQNHSFQPKYNTKWLELSSISSYVRVCVWHIPYYCWV